MVITYVCTYYKEASENVRYYYSCDIAMKFQLHYIWHAFNLLCSYIILIIDPCDSTGQRSSLVENI